VEEVSPQEKKRLVAAARLALLELESINQRPREGAAVFCSAGRAGGLLRRSARDLAAEFLDVTSQVDFRLYEFFRNSLNHLYA